jgi:predicted amidohydrolase YtcJ
MVSRVCFSICFLLSVATRVSGDDYADLAFVSAKVITVNSEQPSGQAIAIAGNKILAVGTNAEIQRWIGEETQVIDAGRRTIVPGFDDAHLHPVPVYPVLSRLGTVPCDPDHVTGLPELIAALKKKATVTPPGQWIVGTRYQDTKLGRHPTRMDLDQATIDHPIYIEHSSGHVAAVNSLALKLAQVDSDTPDPRGGAFDRDQNGAPTGVLRESAKQLVINAGPPRAQATTEEKIAGYARCFAEYVKHGITSIQIAGTSPDMVGLLQQMDIQARPIRIYAMLKIEHLDDLKQIGQTSGLGDDRLRLGAIKKWFGNSLSGRTCWLYEPYADRPGYYGIPPKDSQTEINRQVMDIHAAGFQACIHANGDREIDMLLDAYERALAKLPRQDHRHRIEHCSVVNEQILRRAKSLGLVLATHSYVYEHGDKMEAYGKQRWNMMHPNRSAIELGIHVAGNSDSPVSAARPLLRIQSMVTRRSAEGKVYGAAQKVTVDQALRAWTLGSAHASFEEQIKGSIEPGKLADLVVLSDDPKNVAEDQISDIQVEMTVIGGAIVYQRDPK